MFIQLRDERQPKKKKPARLKTQKKNSLGKSQGQKKKKEARWAENPKGRSRQKLGPKKKKKKENPTKWET